MMMQDISAYSAVVPAKAGTQYSPTLVIEPSPHGVLDARLRGHDGGGWNASPSSPRAAQAEAAAGCSLVESSRSEAMPAAADNYPALMIRGVKLSSARASEHFFLLSRETTGAHSRHRLREAVRAARRELRKQTRKAANSEAAHARP